MKKLKKFNRVDKTEYVKTVLKANFPNGEGKFTLGEFAEMIGASNASSARYYLNKLEDEGFLTFKQRGEKGSTIRNIVVFGKPGNCDCDMEIQFNNDTLHMCKTDIGYAVDVDEVAKELMMLPTTAHKIIKANEKQFEHYVIETNGKKYLNGSGLIALITKINLDRAKKEKVDRLKEFQMWVIENIINISNGSKTKVTEEDMHYTRETIEDLANITPEEIHVLFEDLQKKIEAIVTTNENLREKLQKKDAQVTVLTNVSDAYRQELSNMRQKILSIR